MKLNTSELRNAKYVIVCAILSVLWHTCPIIAHIGVAVGVLVVGREFTWVVTVPFWSRAQQKAGVGSAQSLNSPSCCSSQKWSLHF